MNNLIESKPRQWVFGVGCPRTGTKTLARMLGGIHETHAPILSDVLRGIVSVSYYFDALCSTSSNIHVFNEYIKILPQMLERFSGAKFILTVRNPLEWYKSLVRCGHKSTFREALEYWKWHNDRVIELIPEDRLLLLATEKLSDRDTIVRLSDFLGIPEHTIILCHENKSRVCVKNAGFEGANIMLV